MTKLTLDMATFKALASDTRLDILKTLDGKKMALKDISKATRLNKATLHEHLSKLNEAGLVNKKEREGHKWVYYKLTWKGECLLHPENTRIVVLFSVTFLTLCVGILNLVSYVKGRVVGQAINSIGSDSTALYALEDEGAKLLKTGLAPPISYTQAPITNVPLTNQTTAQLSQAFVDNADLRGILGNTIPSDNIGWVSSTHGIAPGSESVEFCSNAINGGSETLAYGGDAASNVPQGLVAIVHDPAFQYIAIACIVIFSVLICVSIWRFKKSRSQKL